MNHISLVVIESFTSIIIPQIKKMKIEQGGCGKVITPLS